MMLRLHTKVENALVESFLPGTVERYFRQTNFRLAPFFHGTDKIINYLDFTVVKPNIKFIGQGIEERLLKLHLRSLVNKKFM